MRPYYENFRAEQWGEVPEDGDGFWLQRYMFHADFHLGKKARAFVQLKSGIELGRPTGPRPPDEDKLDVNQLFFDYTFSFGAGRQGAASASGGASAGGGGAGSSLTVRLGRQELNYGSGRLVSAREGPNVRSSFDGAKLIFRSGDWRADAFAARPVTTERGYFDDRANSRLAFWGVYVVRRLPRMPGASVDLYYLGLDRKAARFEQGAGRDRRHSAGARLWNRGRAFDYDLEGVYQFGSFDEGRPSRGIRAWTVSTTTGYTFRRTRFAPRASLYTGIASGDKDPNDGLLQTFHPVFPRGAYFGQIGANGALNVRGFRPLLTLQVLKDVSVGAGSYFFWRDSRRDGLYAVPGVLLRRSGASRARFIGSQPEVEVAWKVDRHTTLSLNYARFFVGRFLEETGPSENTRYFAAWVTYKF